MSSQRIKLVSLFSGIGCQEIAAWKVFGERLKIEAFCEIDEKTASCYRVLHGKEIPNLGDISSAKISAKLLDGSVDILTASFPCQTFSSAGSRSGFDPSDKRGTMLDRTLSVIRRIFPRVVIFENVAAVRRHGAEKIITDSIGDVYDCSFALLNAKDFGIPQSRLRWFGVCIRKDTISSPFAFPPAVVLTKCVGDIVDPSVKNLKERLTRR